MQAHVDAAYTAVFEVLGDSFTCDELIRLVELYRGKPLRIETAALPIGISGYCVGLRDLDLIRTRNNLDTILLDTVRLHELAHLLLGHITDCPLTYAEFAGRADMQQGLQRAHAGRYAQPQEQAAEMLATLLLECVLREQQAIPQMVRALYGETRS